MSTHDVIVAYYGAHAENRTFDTACAFMDAVYTEHYGQTAPENRRKLRKIQAAGTNGKGSTVTMLASILTRAGYKTGLYTSPSLCRINERIAIDGEYISDDDLMRYMPVLKAAEKKLDFSFGGFDRMTAACYLYFLDSGVDFAVMETGLGGRFDTVTAVDGLILASITEIGIDHTKMLGKTITEIAWDKCGMIRPGVPVISHPQNAAAASVIQSRARENNSSLRFVRAGVMTDTPEHSIHGQTFTARSDEWDMTFSLQMTGTHQQNNALNALNCVLELNRMGYTDISMDTIAAGLSEARIRGRAEYLQMPGIKTPLFLDGAHNPAAMTECMKTLTSYFPNERKYTAVVSIMRDKDVEGVIEKMAPYIRQAVCVSITDRSLSTDELKKRFESRGIPAVTAENAEAGLALADGMCESGDIIPVTGSLYLVGETLNIADRRKSGV